MYRTERIREQLYNFYSNGIFLLINIFPDIPLFFVDIRDEINLNILCF